MEMRRTTPIQTIQRIRRRQKPRVDPPPPSERARISQELKEWCDAPFGSDFEDYYSLEDYNKDTLELNEMQTDPRCNL